MRVLLAATSFAATGPVRAASAGKTLQVAATIVQSGTASGTTLIFGDALDVLVTSSLLGATASMSVTCSNATLYILALNAGANAGGGNFASRVMRSGSHSLAHQLYLDRVRCSVWDDGLADSCT